MKKKEKKKINQNEMNIEPKEDSKIIKNIAYEEPILSKLEENIITDTSIEKREKIMENKTSTPSKRKDSSNSNSSSNSPNKKKKLHCEENLFKSTLSTGNYIDKTRFIY